MARAKVKQAKSTKKTAAAGSKSKAPAKKSSATRKSSGTGTTPAKKTAAKAAARTSAPAASRKTPAKKAAPKAGPKVVPKKAAVKKAASKKTPKVAAKKIPTKTVAPVKTREKAPKPGKKQATGSKPPAPEKKKAGIAEVKAAAVRTKKKASKRGRKRQRVTPTSTPLANWIPKDGLRPSSFLPAPPRAQSAFTVAAAPASSDRLVRAEDLAPRAPIRTIPVLVHVVQDSGRIEVRTNPLVVEVAPGDLVEWDFRYSGGADVLVAQVAIEIGRPSPFGKTAYKSAKPGSARPHRQVSDIVRDKSLGSTTEYTIHCTNAYKTELAHGGASIVVREAVPTDAAH